MIKFLSGDVDYSTYTTSLKLLDIQAKTDYSALYSIYIVVYKLILLIDEIKSKLKNKEAKELLKEFEEYKIQSPLNLNIESHLEKTNTQILDLFAQIPDISENDLNIFIDNYINPLLRYLADDTNIIGRYIHKYLNDSDSSSIYNKFDKIKKAIGELIGEFGAIEKMKNIKEKIKECKQLAKVLSKENEKLCDETKETEEPEKKLIEYKNSYKNAADIADGTDEILKIILKIFKGDTIKIQYVNKDPILKAYKKTLAAIDAAEYAKTAKDCIDKTIFKFGEIIKDNIPYIKISNDDSDTEEEKKRKNEEQKENANAIAIRASQQVQLSEKEDDIESILDKIFDLQKEIIEHKNKAIDKIKDAINKARSIEKEKKDGNISKPQEEEVKGLIKEVTESTKIV